MKKICLLLSTMLLAAANAGACSYPEPTTFAESLENASDVFSFG